MVHHEELDHDSLLCDDRWPVYEAERGEVLLEAGRYEAASIVTLGCSVRFVAPTGEVIAEAPPGTVAGVGQVVWRSQRMAHSVVVTEPGAVLVLPREVLSEMRRRGDPMAARWERYALLQMWESLRALNDAMDDLKLNCGAGRAPRQPTWLDELRQVAHVPWLVHPAPDLREALRGTALFEDATPEALDELVPLLDETVREAGLELYEQDELGEGVHLVLKGSVELARKRRGFDEPAVYATATEGALLGLNTVFGAMATESAVAATRATLLTLPATEASGLVERRGPAATSFRVALLRAMADMSTAAESRVVQLLAERNATLRAEAAAFIAEDRAASRSTSGYRVKAV